MGSFKDYTNDRLSQKSISSFREWDRATIICCSLKHNSSSSSITGGILFKDFDDNQSRAEVEGEMYKAIVSPGGSPGGEVVNGNPLSGQMWPGILPVWPLSPANQMDLSYLKNYIYEAPRETFEPSYQEKSDIYKPKSNKVYEHIKKEIDSRTKKVKNNEKNTVIYQVWIPDWPIRATFEGLYFYCDRDCLLMPTEMLPWLSETETSRMTCRTRRGEKSNKEERKWKFCFE